MVFRSDRTRLLASESSLGLFPTLAIYWFRIC
jgi:hypothetical protein